MDNNYNNGRQDGYQNGPAPDAQQNAPAPDAQQEGYTDPNSFYGQQNGYQNNTAPNGYDPQNGYQGAPNGYSPQGGYQGSPNGYGQQGGYQGSSNGYGQQGGYQGSSNGYGPQGGYQGTPNGYGQQGGYQNYYDARNPYANPNGYIYNPYEVQDPGSPGLAIASMITGIFSFIIACCYPVAFFIAIVSIILGSVALKKQTPGKGMAIAGIILSGLTLFIAAVFIAISIKNGELIMFEEFMSVFIIK